MSPELTAALTGVGTALGGVALWRLLATVYSRWMDDRKDQRNNLDRRDVRDQADDQSIRAAQALRITELERRLDVQGQELRIAEAKVAQLEKEVEWLRKTCIHKIEEDAP